MSKKYDEYLFNHLLLDEVVVDSELQREIRDRSIMDLVKAAIKCGYDLTYGDVRRIIDKDQSEKEYEKQLIKTR